MVILRSQNKINDFLMILAWASPFKQRRARFIIVWVMGNNWMGAVYTRGAQRTT